MTIRCHGAPQDSVSAWLARTFPRQHVLRAEIAAELRRCPVLLLDPPNKSLFGDIVELAIGLTLGDQPPYLQLFDCLDLGLRNGCSRTTASCAPAWPDRRPQPDNRLRPAS